MLLGVAGCASNAGGVGNLGEPGDAGSRSSDGAVVSGQDSDAIAQLVEIAVRDAKPEGPVGITECWAPSQNPVSDGEGAGSSNDVDGGIDANGSTDENYGADRGAAADANEFRVLCRVHFEQQGAERYRDMICIGNLGRDPVAEYCYQWAYYAGAPKFEDRPAFAASDAR